MAESEIKAMKKKIAELEERIKKLEGHSHLTERGESFISLYARKGKNDFIVLFPDFPFLHFERVSTCFFLQ